MRDANAVDRAEAARILATGVWTVDRMIRRGELTPARRYATAQLPREQVEHVALTTRPARYLAAGGYWVTRAGAAGILGVSGRRVGQLADADRLPYVVHSSGQRLFRRAQLEVVGRARRVRFAQQ